ncbi:MAG: hypothetical protein HYS53_03175 [Candidatus Aenigmarchaeota archaeon]|nr:hypothetical protein [Candidatus Aenigmarchaeota archaeon]
MRLLAFLVAALLVIPNSLASYITINAQLPEISANENAVPAKFTISNTGDERAFSVQTSFNSAGDFLFPILFHGELEPEKQVDTFFNVNITGSPLPGRYPVLIITEYADANYYQFSAVSSSYIAYKERTSSEVNGFLDDVDVPKGGGAKTKLRVVNRGSAERSVKISVYVPKELFAIRNTSVLLKPGEQASIDVEISSLAALQGSTYTVFATIEYEDSGKHYSSFSRGLVRITKNEGVFSNTAIGVAVLVMAFAALAYNFSLRKR